MLGDPPRWTQFVAGVPILANRSRTAESPEFQADFLEYMKDNYGPEEQEAPAPEVKLVTGPGAAEMHRQKVYETTSTSTSLPI